MTNGRGAGMASFMTKKKKYKFHVDIWLEELLEVPFLSAVLFAKLRLLDGGSFLDHSCRQEVIEHKVMWGSKFSFPCKMMANATTGVLERCILRISIRKELKGGRSFNKLGFVDLNLAEFAGAGLTHKKALLEGYDARHRQDNSMLQFSIEMNMISGDVLFKVPSPSLKHKVVNTEETEPRSDEFSGDSLAGSIASGSSGFGSLPKKRPNLLSSDLVIGQTLTENSIPITIATDCSDNVVQIPPEQEEIPVEPGHSRNSSNTSQLSKASGYSSIHSHSHSRQSSSGDSGHIRNLLRRSIRIPPFSQTPPTFTRVNTYPNRIKIPNTHSIPSTHKEMLITPKASPPSEPNYLTPPGGNTSFKNQLENTKYFTPNEYNSQVSNVSTSSAEEYKTPESSNVIKNDIFSQNFNELQKSQSTSVVEQLRHNNVLSVDETDHIIYQNSTQIKPVITYSNRISLDEFKKDCSHNKFDGVLRSKSEFEIPRLSPIPKHESKFRKISDSLSFLTPGPNRKKIGSQSTPENNSFNKFVVPSSFIPKNQLHSHPEIRATSMNSLQTGNGNERQGLNAPIAKRGLPHRKLLEGSTGGKLTPLAISPDEPPATTVSSDCSQTSAIRRPSVTTNPSSSSLVSSETGSLDRAKAAYERRKKTQAQDSENSSAAPGRVEITRVNPDHLIAELLKDTNLDQTDDSAENSGLQLFIAKDGTAALGNHEVKSQMSTGVQVFKQVVMDDNR